jgi:hypothetical protein
MGGPGRARIVASVALAWAVPFLCGCGGGSKISRSSTTTGSSAATTPTIAGAFSCGRGITANNCAFAPAVYDEFSAMWATRGTPPSSLTVRTNPVVCSDYAGGTWYCKSRRSQVALEFRLLKPSPSATTKVQAPPASAVAQAVGTIASTCINKSYNAGANVGPATEASDTLIAFSSKYGLDARLGPSSLSGGKVHTLRQAIGAARAFLKACDPADYAQLGATLKPQ